MNNDFTLYGVLDISTGKLRSDLSSNGRKYWDRKINAERAIINSYGRNKDNLKVVEIECKVRKD